MNHPNLTSGERKILDHLSLAWKEYTELGDKHPDDDHEFRHALHAAQNLIAFRVARRVDPECWWRSVAELEHFKG